MPRFFIFAERLEIKAVSALQFPKDTRRRGTLVEERKAEKMEKEKKTTKLKETEYVRSSKGKYRKAVRITAAAIVIAMLAGLPLPFGANGAAAMTATGVEEMTAYAAGGKEITERPDGEQAAEISEIIDALSVNETAADLLPKLFLQRDFLTGYLANGGTLTDEQKSAILRQIQIDINSDMSSSVLGYLCKDTLVLCAMGIDPTTCKVKTRGGQSGAAADSDSTDSEIVSIPEKIASASASNLTIYNAPYVLLAYAANEKCSPEGVAADIKAASAGSAVLTKDTVIRYILDNQAKDGDKAGSFGGNFASPGNTASVILGFAGYEDYESADVKNSEITDSIEAAYDYILRLTPESGDFGSPNDNAYIILAGAMLGRDPREINKGGGHSDVIDALLSYSLGTGKGFKYIGSAVNLMATADAMRALTAFRNYADDDELTKANIYDFTDKVLTAEENWPDGRTLSDLFVSAPPKTLYKKGEALDTTGMTVTAKYSDGTIKVLAEGEYQISKLSSTTAGAKSITVTYKETAYGIEESKRASFIVNVTDDTGSSGGSGAQTSEQTVTTTVKNADGKVLADGTTVINKNRTTIMEVLKQVLAAANMTATIKDGSYVVSIDGLGEFDMGGNSGWMVRVDGVLIETSAAQYKLQGGEEIEWFYTKDWTKVPGAGGSKAAALTVIKNKDAAAAAEKANNFISNTVTNPAISSIGGEWSIIARERGSGRVPAAFTAPYYENAEAALKESGGVLDSRRVTENARAAIAFTALGQDASNVYGYDLLAPLADMNKVTNQGINGAIWTLTAFDSGDYDIPKIDASAAAKNNAGGAAVQTTRAKLINTIVGREIDGGGFALSGSEADIDITAMALTALAPYRNEEKAKGAIDRGVTLLSKSQNSNGGYTAYGSENSESTAQTVIALCTLGIDPDADKRFIKNGNSLIDNLLSYQLEDGSFEHTKGGGSDLMATEQALLSLAAYERFTNSLSPLYDMTDIEGVSARLEKGAVKVVIDNSQIKFTAYTGRPFIDSADRTQAPIRIVTEALGCDVSWDNSAKLAVISKDDVKVYITVGSNEITIDSAGVQNKQIIDTTARIIDDRTYIPLRAVVEAVGGTISWEGSSRTARIER